jgi:mannosylglycerate hydrolase
VGYDQPDMDDVSKRTFVVVSHTHWDREWYQPFEEFRVRLVRMMDSLLDLLDRDPEYRHFVLDGQTIVLDDYLEVRPERRPDIERLVRDGRLLIGPHYVLPDEFLIGGESWVRDLQIGIRAARQFGPVMMTGYSPDAFGHIAHLPAILRGFGIDSIVLWRGVSREATKSEFLWRSPDGSEVLVLHLPFGYGIAITLPADAPGLRNLLGSLRGLLEPLATSRYVLVPNGNDHASAQENLPLVIRTANELFDDAEFVHGHYPMLIEAIRREAPEGGLPRLEGEFRSSQRSHVLAGVLSARMWIKQRYQQCEDLLARYAEPTAAWAHLLRVQNGEPSRGPSDQALLRQAWKLLLQNAPHDSICGCSIDQVHEEMRPRFDRCQQIAEAVLYGPQRYVADLASRPGESSVVVFNSESGPRTDFCTVRLPLDARSGDAPTSLVDEAGREIPLQLLERGPRSALDPWERVVAGFVAADVPAYGCRAYRVRSGKAQRKAGGGRGEIENEFFRVGADRADGTLSVEDRRTGAVLSGLNRFVDGGDRGDEYNYCPPKDDDLIGSPARPPRLRVTERGPARRTLEIAQAYSLPSRLTEDRDARSPRKANCRIVSRVSLYPGVARIDIETEVENRARDHRLRVHFPTGVHSEHVHAEQHFGVLRRPLTPPEGDALSLETPIATYPQKSFVDVSDGQRGLMVANRGLPEYEALQEDGGTVTIALTLLRCVGWLSRADIRTRRGPAGPSLEAPGAQMPGRWTFHYSLIPHAGDWETSFEEAHRFARPLRAVRTGQGSGGLPPEGSLVDIEPRALVLSSLKLAEDGDSVVARVYNTSGASQEGRLRLLPRPGKPPHASAEVVNLNEEFLAGADADDGWVKLSARPNQIINVRFRTAQETP